MLHSAAHLRSTGGERRPSGPFPQALPLRATDSTRPRCSSALPDTSAHAACRHSSGRWRDWAVRRTVGAWRRSMPPSHSRVNSASRRFPTCRATAARRVTTPSPTFGCSSAGVGTASSRRWTHSAKTLNFTYGGCRTYGGSSRPPSPTGRRSSVVGRRSSVVAGFYRTCVIDSVLEHSPADYVRRPTVPPESPTLGLTHLQFEAMLNGQTVEQPVRLRARVPARPARFADLRDRRRRHRRPG